MHSAVSDYRPVSRGGNAKHLKCSRQKTHAVASVLLGAALAITSTAARADIQVGIDTGIGPSPLCLSGVALYVPTTGVDCSDATGPAPTELRIGSSTSYVSITAANGQSVFNAPVSFNGITQFSNGQAFSGSTAFNSTVTFTGPSVTFSTGTTFANPSTFNGAASFTNGITSNSITNSGAIATNSLTSGSVITTSLLAEDSLVVSSGANIVMGGNQVHGVAAGTASTDAVNVAQLNAATSGITADVTTLQTTTATHTTQIANLQTGLATTNTNVATNSAAIADNTADIAENSADIVDLQTGLADTNAALGVIDGRVGALEELAIDFDSRLDDLKDRADVGTATAVALSGAMFLPGKTFNLTGNVGAYRGAVAGALQFGAMLSDRAAINAGVAKGFNKHGKAAVRAGFTFGW